ncbi:cobalt-precorrin-5B (C(1))-methyltransferase [Sneathiella sp. P13V-1]|uniref:cobalt-precorrin-5B (C(1))-methyltransferase n=1 Tax=Sneathiella sp. P13V-1 TaxID=2697366 RepID=UPI00187B8A06|nr:cobalt-precorrin-5B (C(1))-methyltransferase [Sneathiella sp. P13V-1]MBE7638143.1 cobalt-precorrin-5B (C(1))-methyltransferase [Sneathiella sp. P13V-1]
MDKGDEKKELRYGWTTGACATAATKSALSALLGKGFLDPVTITLPKGQTPAFALATEELRDDTATASIIKDAGDDPDVTHHARIISTVKLSEAGKGIRFYAGSGVGTVTKEGLPLEVGEPAINPVPRQMIQGVIEELCLEAGVSPDVDVTIGIENGEELAKYTMNGRLGIVGGLSVLGTTGIVVPYSCAAWIASLHRGIDVARAAGADHMIASTGSTSEKAANAIYDLPDYALLDMGDFAGGVLKYLKKKPVRKLTLAGGFAKISKLAEGHMDLHSGRSKVNFAFLADMANNLGADERLRAEIVNANTAMEVLQICTANSIPIAEEVTRKAIETAKVVSGGDLQVEILIFDRKGELVGRA